MKTILKGTVMIALVAIMPATGATAQHRDQRGRPGVQKVIKYREMSASRSHKFRKGQRLAANQRRYVVSDWNKRGLRTPPRGYKWVRENNNSGDYLLVAAATGMIASILAQ